MAGSNTTELNSTAKSIQNPDNNNKIIENVPDNWVYHSFMIGLAVLIITHNIFVIYLYRRDRRLRCAANFLLTSLAASDLLTGISVIPLTIASASLFGRTDIGTVLLYFFSNTISDFSTMLIAFNLLLVTADRFLSLCYSLHYNDISRTSRARKAVIAAVFVCLILSCLPLSWTYKILIGKYSQQERQVIDKIETIYQIIYLCVCFFIPAVIILCAIIAMMLTIRKLTTKKKSTPRDPNHKNTQVRAFIQFLVMYMSFLICWSPLMTIRLMITLNYDRFTRDDKLILEILFSLRCLTSLLNPGIHVWCKKDYRHAIIVSKEKCTVVLFKKKGRERKSFMNSRATTLPTNAELGESSRINRNSARSSKILAGLLVGTNNNLV